MKCPYRKKIHIYPDGLGRTTVVEFMECDEKECPYWGVASSTHRRRQEGGYTTYDTIGCRKAEKECS